MGIGRLYAVKNIYASATQILPARQTQFWDFEARTKFGNSGFTKLAQSYYNTLEAIRIICKHNTGEEYN